MKLIELHWNDNKGEGFVKFVNGFDQMHFVTKLDMLQDCIIDLQDKYNEILTAPEKEKT
jgi:hypothetical protein